MRSSAAPPLCVAARVIAKPHIAPAKCNRAMTDRAGVRPCAAGGGPEHSARAAHKNAANKDCTEEAPWR